MPNNPKLFFLCGEATKLVTETTHLTPHSFLCPDQFCSRTWFIHSSAHCRRHKPIKTRVSGLEQKNYHWYWEHLDKEKPLQTNAKSVATKIKSLKSTWCLQGDILDGKKQRTPSHSAFLSKPKSRWEDTNLWQAVIIMQKEGVKSGAYICVSS